MLIVQSHHVTDPERYVQSAMVHGVPNRHVHQW